VDTDHTNTGPQTGVEIAVRTSVPLEYSVAEQVVRVGPAHLIALAFPDKARPNRTDAAVSLHLRHGGALRLPALVELSTPEGHHNGAVIHLRWRARLLSRFFPVMEADLQLHPIAAYETEIALVGTYRPPLGMLGMIGDRLVGSAAATATATAFLDDLSRVLRQDKRPTSSVTE
jgi:hypothetical protein